MTAKTAPAAAAAKSEPVVVGIAKIAIPQRTFKRGVETKFPFDSLAEPGAAFGLKDRTAKSMSSIISTQNRKNLIEKRDDAGNVVYKTNEMRNPDGTVTHVPTTEPERVPGKKFFAKDVDAEFAKTLKGTPLEGSSVVIVREI